MQHDRDDEQEGAGRGPEDAAEGGVAPFAQGDAEPGSAGSAPGPEEPTTETPRDAHEPAYGGPPGGDPPGGVGPPSADDGDAAEPERPRRLYRSRHDRMVAGVAAGLADYFGIDPVIVRVVAVALVFAGGAGVLLYLAAWLLVPEEGDGEAERGRVSTVAGVAALVVALCILLPLWNGPFDGWGWGGPFLSLLVLGVAGLVVWRLASGERPTGGTQDVLRRAGLGVALLALSGALALGGAWATAVGGGTLVAIVVIVVGLWLVAAAFLGGGHWLIIPALALALPAGVVSAANIDTDGGIGEREFRPAAVQDVRDTYRLGIGRLVVDLRDVDLPAGDHRLDVELGLGEAWVVLPEDVCVTSRADVGAGEVMVFNRDVGGVDVEWDDRRRAPAGTPRVVIEGDVGVGGLYVTHEDPDRRGRGRFHEGPREAGNTACAGAARG